MTKIVVEGRLLGWEFGDWQAIINSYIGGYDLYRDMVYIGWFPALKNARMYAIKEDYKDNKGVTS